MPDLMQDLAGNLQQRIGQLVSQYETDMAILRANASQQLAQKDEELAALRSELDTTKETLERVQAEAKPAEREDASDTSAKS